MFVTVRYFKNFLFKIVACYKSYNDLLLDRITFFPKRETSFEILVISELYRFTVTGLYCYNNIHVTSKWTTDVLPKRVSEKNPHKNGIVKSTSVTGNNIYLLKKELKDRLFCFRDEFKLKQYMTFENRIFEIIPTTQSKLHFHSYDKTFFITGT